MVEAAPELQTSAHGDVRTGRDHSQPSVGSRTAVTGRRARSPLGARRGRFQRTRRASLRAITRADPSKPARFGHLRLSLRAPAELPDPSRRPGGRGVNRCVNVISHPSIHTSIHTTFTGSARRPRKLNRRAKLAPEMSGTGGIVAIRSGQRIRRRAARTMSREMTTKSSYPGIKNSDNRRTRLTWSQNFPEPRHGGNVDSTRWHGQPS